MDPQATLDSIYESIEDKDYASAVAGLGSYYRWRLKGGFEPRVQGEVPGDVRAENLTHLVADALEEIDTDGG